jgi:hypothetical protein
MTIFQRISITAQAAIFGVVVAGTARCHAQTDSDCTPAAQRVAHDLLDDGTFSDDQTIRDILRWGIEKCSGSQAGQSEFTTVRGGPDQEVVLLLGSILEAVDRSTFRVWDMTHDQERSKAAGEVTRRLYDEALASMCEKAHILRGVALANALNSQDLFQAEKITNDHYLFSDQEQLAAYHSAWAKLSTDQLVQLAEHAESLKPSVVFALREAVVLPKSESDVEVKHGLADLNRIISDVRTEQELRERQTTR